MPRQLRQPALLAAHAEHLDPVDAGRVTAGQQPAPLVRALRERVGLVEPSLAERDRRPAVLGDVQVEGLRGALGGRVHRGHLLARGLEVEHDQQRRHAPQHRLGLEVDVAELGGEVARLGQQLQHLRRASWCRATSSCPASTRQSASRSPSTRAIATASSRTAAPRSCWPPICSARASPPSTPTRSRDGCPIERLGRPREQLDGVRVLDRRAPAGLLVADRRLGEQLGVGRELRGLGVGAQRVDRAAGAVADQCRARSAARARSAGSSTPSESATLSRSSASS